jgi:hypothetical protein
MEVSGWLHILASLILKNKILALTGQELGRASRTSFNVMTERKTPVKFEVLVAVLPCWIYHTVLFKFTDISEECTVFIIRADG